MENCEDCKYSGLDCDDEPCKSCDYSESTDHFSQFVPKEGEKKVKTYKADEIIKMLRENPKLKVESNLMSNSKDSFSKHIFSEEFLNADFRIVQQEVTFLEAVKALYSGKTIRVETGDKAHSYLPYDNGIRDEKNCAITTSEILNGKWFIE